MSNAAAPKRPLPDLDPEIGLICIAADSLIPLFKKGTIDTSLARRMAMSSIEAYCPESRADAVNIARTIAFSMAAIALLGSASADDLTMNMKLRAYGRANTLNRSADQSERTMMQRQRYQRTHPPEYHEEQTRSQPAEPDMQAAEAEIKAAVAEVMKHQLPADHPAQAEAAHSQAAHVEAPQAKPQVFRPEPQSPAPTAAIHHSVPKAQPSHQQAASFKSSLLHQNALQRVLNEDAHLAAKLTLPQSATRSGPAAQSTSAANPIK